MNNKKKYVKTDLAIELLKEKKDYNYTNIIDNIKVTKIYLDFEKSKLYNKSIGNYITIIFDDAYKYENEIVDVLKNELFKLIKNKEKVLIIGLGNRNSTPDSLGTEVVEKIIVSDKVCAISPGVYTGIETFDYVEALSKKIKPTVIILVDSLVSGSFDRINKTIQMSDTGISPGSGVRSNKKEISYSNIKVPVISIGVPTVADIKNIINEDNIFDLMVTPKEIDFDIKILSNIISNAINKSLYDTL